jgi:glycosyltransferase involved in cell wall biosynthesis
MHKKLFIVVNVDRFFLSHRKEIAVESNKRGFDVTIIARNTGQKDEIKDLGLNYIELPISKSGKNIFQEFYTLLFLFFLYRRKKPDIVHHVGIKTILYGTLAAKLFHIKGVVNAVSGLGILFSKESDSLLSKLVISILRFSHKQKNLIVIFQNDEDRALFLNNGIIKEDQTFKIKGSGINLHIYNFMPEPDVDKICIIFAARMIKEKGVFELIGAANLLKEKYQDKILFLLCGGTDDNPHALTDAQLNSVSDGQYIIWLGYRTDIRELLEQSHIVAFPSYYREGLPKSLIEACAVGRPIVTTDSIGCRDTVIDGYNGFLIPIKNSEALAEKLKILINDRPLRKLMGINSRKLAEREFSINNVVEKHLMIYNKLINVNKLRPSSKNRKK